MTMKSLDLIANQRIGKLVDASALYSLYSRFYNKNRASYLHSPKPMLTISGCNVFIPSNVQYAFIGSPQYSFSFGKSVACSYTVTAPKGRRVHLAFNDMDLGNRCAASNLSVYDGSNDSAEKLYTLCGYNTITAISKGLKMFLKYETTGESGRGFLAIIQTYHPSCKY